MVGQNDARRASVTNLIRASFSVKKAGRRLWTTLFILLALLAPPLFRAQATPSVSQTKAVSQFVLRAKKYLADERKLPADKLKPTSDIASLNQQRLALRKAVRESRPNAKQGDLFGPDQADAFRHLLALALNGPDGHKIKASLEHAEPNSGTNLEVNAPYPNGSGRPLQSIPPSLLQSLPVLPKGLEYCLSGKTLALRDTNANLVVDFLPNALP